MALEPLRRKRRGQLGSGEQTVARIEGRGYKKRGLWAGLKGKTTIRPRHGSSHLYATPFRAPWSLGKLP